MFAEKACKLIKESDNRKGVFLPYNLDLIEEVIKETVYNWEENHLDVQANEESRLSDGATHLTTVHLRHSTIHRNIRCLLSYHYNRLKYLRSMRWHFGIILPPEIKNCLSSSECVWFSKYSTILAKYMRSLNKHGGGVNLLISLKPPKMLYIEIKCFLDYGKYELSDGSVVILKKDTRYFLPRFETEELIRQGICQHITH